MRAQPKNEASVLAVPAVAQMMAEETPRLLVVFVWHENAKSSPVDVGARGHVLFPDNAEEERASTGHDGYVGESPIRVVILERLNDEEEKGVTRDGAHSVVGDACRIGLSRPGWIGQKGVETSLTALPKSAKL